MTTIKFTKMVATGNDFVVIQNLDGEFDNSGLKILAPKICERKWGIGADGLLVLEKSKSADFKMRIFNPDGSEPDMCGNGSRCVALYAKRKKIAKEKMKIETLAGILEAQVKGKNIKINLTKPYDLKLWLKISVDGVNYEGHFINTGVPHIVLFVDEIDKLDVYNLGSKMRHHKDFSPNGTNVDFVKVTGKNSIRCRTYERGVEDETLACGTGVVAAAIISGIVKNLKPPIKVITRGGELKVYFDLRNNQAENVYLEGPAEFVFKGSLKI